MIRIAAQDEEAMAQAGAWLARLQRDGLTEHDSVEFEAWLAVSPGNAGAYRRALELWHEFESGADAVLAELEGGRDVRRPTSRRWLMGAGGLAAAAGLALALAPSLLAPTATQAYATGKGQHQSVKLADGSSIDLNAETRLQVRLASAERRVVMGDGEAIFDVAPDKSRPFIVETPSRIVRVVGTQFDVRSRDGRLTVTVARGRVQVRPAKATAPGRDVLLTPGQRLEVARTGAEALDAVDPEEAFGWRAGRLVYRATPLSEVVADLNRQYQDQIEISDPKLGQMPITGVIVLDDQPAVMARLALMLPIRSVPSERGLLLLRK